MVGGPAALRAATSGEEEAAAGLGPGVPELVRQAGVVVRVAARQREDDGAGFVVVAGRAGGGRPGRAVEGAEADGAVLRRLCRRRRHPGENVCALLIKMRVRMRQVEPREHQDTQSKLVNTCCGSYLRVVCFTYIFEYRSTD